MTDRVKVKASTELIPPGLINRYRVDVLVTVILVLAAGTGTYWASGLIDPVINSRQSWDVWFDSDAPRVFDNMVSRYSDHSRTSIHPFFSLISFLPVYFLRIMLGFNPEVAVRLTLAGAASVWVATLYVLLRSLKLKTFDAVVFVTLNATSAAAGWLSLRHSPSVRFHYCCPS
jgi:hypothetical protein